ncbi:hypothetical protein ACF0H5_006970 [Mactra antiquata]
MDVMGDTVVENRVAELKEIFKPFDININPEKYKIEYPKNLVRKACVLIPLCVIDGEYHLILTLRSEKLTHHAGYVAFPGGMQDETDQDNIHTALREAKEEIGLEPKDVRVIASMSPGLVKPRNIVYPVIGLVPSDFKPVINEHEVTLVFKVPLKRFLSSERRRVDEFTSEVQATYHVYHFIDNFEGKEVDTWGFTATLCVMTALAIYQTDQKFCFFDKFEINKDRVFPPDSVRKVLAMMMKPAAKY